MAAMNINNEMFQEMVQVSRKRIPCSGYTMVKQRKGADSYGSNEYK